MDYDTCRCTNYGRKSSVDNRSYNSYNVCNKIRNNLLILQRISCYKKVYVFENSQGVYLRDYTKKVFLEDYGKEIILPLLYKKSCKKIKWERNCPLEKTLFPLWRALLGVYAMGLNDLHIVLFTSLTL